jgi:hypothetical protein
VWRLDDAGTWTATTYGPGDAVALTSVDLSMPMDSIYEDSGL